MVDRLSEVRIVSMYKGGYDSLGISFIYSILIAICLLLFSQYLSIGEEIMCTLPEKETISRKLVRISMLRLAKHLSMTERQVHLTPEVEGMVKELASEVDDVASVDLSKTANLLVALTNNDLSDVDQQNVYDWLAVAQTLIRSQS